MKRVMNPLSRSKSAILLMFVSAGISMAIPACKKDDAATSIPAVSQEDASVMVNQSLFSSEGNGLMFQTDNAVSVAGNYGARQQGAKFVSEDCGIKKENSFVVKSEPSTSDTSYSYSILWNWTLSCSSQSEPMSFTMATNANISYTTAKVSVVDSSVAAFNVSGLQADSAFLLINQTYNHVGTMTIKTGDSTATFHNVITYKSTDVKVSKATRAIVSGTADVTISGTNKKGQPFSYSGTITYSGDYKAKFLIKGGASFELSWINRK